MRTIAALGAICLVLITGGLATAQVSVSAQTERTNFLLYERVDLLVSIANSSDTDIVLDNNEGHPWLSFMVSKANHQPVHSERESTFRPVTLKVGETKTLRVNITPLFTFRESGDYRASVVIDLPGSSPVVSEPVPFSVLNGRTVWTATRPVDNSQRVYSLIRFSASSSSTGLYLRVEDPTANIVYTNLALGEVVASIDPEVFFDPQGNIHVMQPVAMSTYLYTRADASGKILHQAIFKNQSAGGFGTVPPRLTKLEDGNVIVLGGIEQNPDQPRETLSGGQKQADSAPSNPADSAPSASAAAAEPPVGSALPSR